jgi:tetratricopeptide (TPR) repeat protein
MKGGLAIQQSPECKWTVKSGPMAGVVQNVHSPSFTIGRSTECEFVIVDDPKCSRRHAAVRWTATGFEILCLSEPNKVFVNGKEVTQTFLQNNDIVKLGETEMQFNLMSAPKAVPQRYAPDGPAQRPKSKSRAPAKGNSKRLLIYGGIGLVVLWVIFSPDAAKKKELAIRTEQQIQAEIDSAVKLKETAEATNGQVDWKVPQRQAQEHYVKGFRDYRKHQYERALESFQACLALQPDHILCTRYFRLAQRKFDELIQYQIVLGRKYRDQNQYKSCRSAFRNVMVMVRDAQTPAYKEAKANYEACNALVEGRF